MSVITINNYPTKKQALEKMLEEMKQSHTGAEDAIHNWLCDQEDDELFEAILKEDRTINQAMQYCVSKARESVTGGNVAMIDDATVYGWAREYFLLDEVPTLHTSAVKVETSVDAAEPDLKLEEPASKPKKKPAAKKKAEPINPEGEQLDLLSFL